MTTNWKNYLQEYCQKQKISLPNYRIKKQCGPGHILQFQVEVEVNGHRYIGNGLCSSKKEAEQLAARKAWQTLASTSTSAELSTLSISETYSDVPPSYSEVVNAESSYHLPSEYAHIEQFIVTKVGVDGGIIRKILPLGSQGRYKLEISGSYRYCENIKRHHKKNQICFIVDTVRKTYIQKCHDPQCYGFQSAVKHIDNNSMSKFSNGPNTLRYESRSDCERCGEIFSSGCLYECELCNDAVHCERCFDACFYSHDS